MTFKEQVVERYQLMLRDRLELFEDMLKNMSTNSRNDAKSSAGDKHETALAMMHIEQEKIANKIAQITEEIDALKKIDFRRNYQSIGVGSLVNINDNYFLVSIALPKITIQEASVFGISTESPLCKEIMGQKIGFECVINSTKYIVKDVF